LDTDAARAAGKFSLVEVILDCRLKAAKYHAGQGQGVKERRSQGKVAADLETEHKDQAGDDERPSCSCSHPPLKLWPASRSKTLQDGATTVWMPGLPAGKADPNSSEERQSSAGGGVEGRNNVRSMDTPITVGAVSSSSVALLERGNSRQPQNGSPVH